MGELDEPGLIGGRARPRDEFSSSEFVDARELAGWR